jgi:hypothetical protein
MSWSGAIRFKSPQQEYSDLGLGAEEEEDGGLEGVCFRIAITWSTKG